MNGEVLAAPGQQFSGQRAPARLRETAFTPTPKPPGICSRVQTPTFLLRASPEAGPRLQQADRARDLSL